MRAKFVGLFTYILLSIYRAEGNKELKTGDDKLDQVLADLQLKSVQLGILRTVRESFPEEIIGAIIAVIDAVVTLLNLLGIFKRTKAKA